MVILNDVTDVFHSTLFTLNNVNSLMKNLNKLSLMRRRFVIGIRCRPFIELVNLCMVLASNYIELFWSFM